MVSLKTQAEGTLQIRQSLGLGLGDNLKGFLEFKVNVTRTHFFRLRLESCRTVPLQVISYSPVGYNILVGTSSSREYNVLKCPNEEPLLLSKLP